MIIKFQCFTSHSRFSAKKDTLFRRMLGTRKYSPRRVAGPAPPRPNPPRPAPLRPAPPQSGGGLGAGGGGALEAARPGRLWSAFAT